MFVYLIMFLEGALGGNVLFQTQTETKEQEKNASIFILLVSNKISMYY